MWKKYGDKYEFYCADLPPIFNGGIYEGYHLTHQPDQAKRWGKHKAWIDPNYKVDGKPVVLVWKADSSVTCEDCGLESKTVPKGKRCPRCKKREFIYLNGNTEEHLDFRTPKDIEKEQVESFHDTLGGYMHGAY